MQSEEQDWRWTYIIVQICRMNNKNEGGVANKQKNDGVAWNYEATSKQENDGVAWICRLVNKQESEVVKGGLTSCACCKSEGGAAKVLARKNTIIWNKILHNAKVNNIVLKQWQWKAMIKLHIKMLMEGFRLIVVSCNNHFPS